MAATNTDDTVDYIQKLMQGSGASINYEEIQRELNSGSLASKSDFGTSSVNRLSERYDHSDDISDIPQETFTRSNNGSKSNTQANKTVSERRSSPELTPTLSTGVSAKTVSESGQVLENAQARLQKLSQRLEKQGWTLHKCLKTVFIGGQGMGSGQAEEMCGLIETLLDEISKDHLKAQSKARDYDIIKKELAFVQYEQAAAKERNATKLVELKKQYRLGTLDPKLVQIVESYEDKLEETIANSKIEGKEYQISSPDAKALKIQDLQYELEKVTQECELLKLKLLSKPVKSREGLSTRQQIEKDKKDHFDRSSKFSKWTHEDLVVTLQDIMEKLGVPDVNQLTVALDQIVYVYKLLPQMEQFIREANAIVSAYDKEHEQPLKLKRSMEIIRTWAHESTATKEYEKFVSSLHEILFIPAGPGSLELVLAEVEQMVDSKAQRSVSGDTDAELAIKHFKNLFELGRKDIVTRINELYVFCAEINDGLSKLKEILNLEDNTQANRVLTMAAEKLKGFK